ncbi:MAG: NADH-quinone oxidoreductase subunit [Frankiales bacterium]|jgi:NADH-quinone oxidoreductase subunit M|nr:NADH-quinone oxidoreductase subunit [Frankiales bacterium]
MSTVPWLTIIGAVPLVGSLAVAMLPRDPAPETLAEREREYALTAPSPAIEAELEARMADYDERHGSAAGDLLDADEIDRDVRERYDPQVDRRPAQDLLAKQVALGVSLITLGVAIAMSLRFQNNGGFQFVQTYDWVKDFGVRYSVGVDGIGLVLIDLTAILMPVVVLAAWGEEELGGRSVKTYLALLLALQATLIGAFGSTDLFLFYVFFEVMLIPMYFVIGSFGTSAASGARRSYAAVKFLLYSLFGGLLMLAAVIALYVYAGHSFLIGDLTRHAPALSHTTQNLIFLGFFIAFAIKAPLWPFHTWLPDAAAEAPTSGAVMLVGVMDKVGTFGFIRWTLPLLPKATHTFAPLVLSLAVIGIFYGALLAVGQRDLKRLVSYTSIAHFGFIAIGIFAFTSQGGTGATLYMVNHGFSTGALFLVVGFLIARRKSSQVADFGGVQAVAPWLAGAFVLAGLSSLALPGTNSFVSEFLVLVGTFTRYRAFAIVATVGIVLAALYILLVVQRTMHGPLNESNRGFTDLSAREAWVIAPILVLIVALGVYPKPVLDTINPAVRSTLCLNGRTDPVPTHAQQSASSPVSARFDSCTSTGGTK